MNRFNDKGLSLIELIVASLSALALASLSLNSWEVFKDSTYGNQVGLYVKDVLTSMQAGRVDYDMNKVSLLERVSFFADGSPVVEENTTRDSMLPGFQHDPNLSITVLANPACITGNVPGLPQPCIVEQVYIHHCKTTQERQVTRFNNDLEVDMLVETAPNC